MSQDASTSHALLNAVQDSPQSQSWETPVSSGVVNEPGSFSVESYADRLMDELFDDVERVLTGGATRPAQPVHSDPTPSHSGSLPFGLTSMMYLQSDSSAETRSQLEDHLAELSELTTTDPVESGATKTESSGRSYDRLLLAVGCISVIATLAIWLIGKDMHHPPAGSTPVTPAATDSAIQTDQQFADYMQRSLKQFDENTQSNPLATSAPTNRSTPASLPATPLTRVPIPGSLTPAPLVSPRTPTGLERIYVPVYQLPTSANPIAPLPKVTSQPHSALVKTPVPLSIPGVARTLVGVMELGDRSAALIEINGVAQRYRIGESIGTSGWTLVEVSKNQAVIRRNGEVRSVFIGQSF